MALPAESLKLLTTIDEIGRESIPFHDTALADPLGANPAVDGEWFQINDDYELVRYVNDAAHREAAHENAGLIRSFCLIEQVGTTDKQASKKGTVAVYHQYKAKTKIFASAGLFVLCLLEVYDHTYDALTRRGLRLKGTGGSAGVEVAIMLNYDATNDWLTFITV